MAAGTYYHKLSGSKPCSPPALEVSSLKRDFQGLIKLTGSGKGAPCAAHGPLGQLLTEVSIVICVSLHFRLLCLLSSPPHALNKLYSILKDKWINK